MDNKLTLQHIWSITDKPIIDIMTKTKRATPVQNYSDSSSDSESTESSIGPFIAVPEEFRPNVPLHLAKKKPETGKVLHSQEPILHTKNSAFTEYPSSKLNYPPSENMKCKSVECKQGTFQNSTTKVKRLETCPQITKNVSSLQNTDRHTKANNSKIAADNTTSSNKLNYPYTGNTKCKFVECKQVFPNSTTNMKRLGTCSQVTKNISSVPNTDRHNETDNGKYARGITTSSNELNYPTTGNTKCKSAEYKKVTFSNSTTEMKRHETCSQIPKNMFSVESTERHTKAVKGKIATATSELAEEVTHNSLQFKKQNCVSTSKAVNSKMQGNRLQYEHVGKCRGTIQFNFELQTENKSISKGSLKYEAVILENKTPNSHPETKQYNYEKQHHVSFQESIVKWDSSLNLNERSNDHQNKVKQTHDKKTFTPKEKRNTGKNNMKQLNCKPTSSNRMRKPPRENCNQRKFNNSLHETNFKQRKQKTTPNQMKLAKSKLNLQEKEFNSETPFCKNNIQPDNNLNSCIKTKINNCDANTETSSEGFMRLCSTIERNIAHNHGMYPSLPNLTQKNLQELNQNQESNSQSNNSDYRKVKENEDLKSILNYGKDISDLIIGSHTALSTFISLHTEWRILRCELIKHFESLEKNLKESSEKFTKYSDVINMTNKGLEFAQIIPHPYVILSAKIISAFTSLFAMFVNKSKKGNTDDTNEITTSLFKDTQASDELYMFGLQCNQQFDETAKLIEEFHSIAEKHKLFATENRELSNFIQGLLEYKPAHRIFYKKLYKCFQELMDKGKSSDAKKFCEPFTLYTSSALDVIGYLDWRFHYEEFNSQSVRYELEHLHRLIQDSNSTTLKDLVKRIQSCIRILNDELTFMERSLKNITLFDTSLEKLLPIDTLHF